MHSAYEGVILKGRTLANNFVIEFTDYDFPDEFAETDPAIQFPYLACADGTRPGPDNYCWMDHRDEALMVEKCTVANGNVTSALEDEGADTSALEDEGKDTTALEDDGDSAASTSTICFMSTLFLLMNVYILVLPPIV